MTVKVLIVEDSGFFRRRLTEQFDSHPGLEVIGTAVNGIEGVALASSLKPDIITMDIEMPKLDGISAVKRILSRQSVPIVMFSTLTTDGAEATMDALDAGAVDYLPKRFEDIAKDTNEAGRILCERLIAIAKGKRNYRRTERAATDIKQSKAASSDRKSTASASSFQSSSSSSSSSSKTTPAKTSSRPRALKGKYNALVIGTSTGGPIALQEVIGNLPGDFPVPIIVVQHMPSSFSGHFAERLNKCCELTIKEAENNDMLKSGTVYLAPGGRQLTFEGSTRQIKCKVADGDKKLNYKPCVDLTLNSLISIHGDKILALILTGMGSDGTEGAKALKEKGGTVFAQDEATSTVFGMPQSVINAGIADGIYPLERISGIVNKAF